MGGTIHQRFSFSCCLNHVGNGIVSEIPEKNNDRVSEFIIYKPVFRTAPAPYGDTITVQILCLVVLLGRDQARRKTRIYFECRFLVSSFFTK